MQIVFHLFQQLWEKMIRIKQKKIEKCKSESVVMEDEECISQVFAY